MEKRKVCYLNYYFDNSKLLINKKMQLFLYTLIKVIFLKKKSKTTKTIRIKKKLDTLINEVNKNLIKNSENYISYGYTATNLKNILMFAKTQNKLYAGEILENILIIIFSFAFNSKKENTFGKYLYNNMRLIKDNNNKDFKDWFKRDLFLPDELKNIEKLLENDIFVEDIKNKTENNIQKNTHFYNFLYEIYQEKYSNQKKYKLDEKVKNYINGMVIDESEFVLPNIEKIGKTTIYDFLTVSQYTNINSCMLFTGPIGKVSRPPISIMRSFFISIYIYYQNKNSPLMKHRTEVRDEKNNLKFAAIPFSYDLTCASIEEKFAGIIMAPSRIEPRIHEIKMSQNTLKNNGLTELSKVLLFNKNLKSVDFNLSALKTYHINNLNIGLGLFDNYTLEQLNISYNYIKEDCSQFLAKILSHLKGLKTLILSSNDLKGGISFFFIMLKKLYRQGKIKLENLYLNKCILNQIDFYELGELLKSKYCKLKCLYLNENKIPSSINLIKKLKKNKSLSQITFNRCNLGNKDVDNIMRIVNSSNIEHLYLHRNKFTNFNKCLSLLSRTKLITLEEEINVRNNKELCEESSLYNLDLSLNYYNNKNAGKINLLNKIIDETNLNCLDLSQILYGPDPSKKFDKLKNYNKDLNKYIKSVEKLKNQLDEDQRKYEITTGELISNKVDKDKIKDIEKYKKEFKQFEPFISEIAKNENSRYPIFLKENAKRLIIENKEIFDPKNKLTKKEFKEIEKQLVNYMVWKKSDYNLERLNKIRDEKKLIYI